MSVNNISPETLFGGTWEQIQGRFLLASGTPSQNSYNGFGTLTPTELTYNFGLDTTGGEFSHQLAMNEIPRQVSAFSSDNIGNFNMNYVGSGGNFIADANAQIAANNIPPYLVVNVTYTSFTLLLGTTYISNPLSSVSSYTSSFSFSILVFFIHGSF